MGARAHLRQRIVAGRPHWPPDPMIPPTDGSPPGDSRSRRSAAALRPGGPAPVRPRARCRPGCGSLRGRRACRRARGRRWRTPRREYAGAHRVVVGDRRVARSRSIAWLAEVSVRGGRAGAPSPGRGRAARAGAILRRGAGRLAHAGLDRGARRGRRCANVTGAPARRSGTSNERPSVNDGARRARHRLERGCEVGVAGRVGRRARPAAMPGPADQQRHVDVGVVRRLLPRRQAVLAEVEAVVRREHDVGVVELPGGPQACARACATPRSTACSDRMRRR